MFSEVPIANTLSKNEQRMLNEIYSNLKDSASNGDNKSKYYIFKLVINNQPYLNKKLDESFGFLISAGQANHTESQFTIGSLYQTGTIVKLDRSIALGWLLEAANKKHYKAKLMIANNYAFLYVDEKNNKLKEKYFSMAINWYEKVIGTGFYQAERLFGELLFISDGFSSRAEDLLKRAFKGGDVKAISSLAEMYVFRWESTNDKKYFLQAESAFKKAISFGDKDALVSYSKMTRVQHAKKK